METMYHIVVDVTTTRGLTEVGSFQLGSDLEFATTTFDALKGIQNGADDSIIRMSLIEIGIDSIPNTIKSIGCTLNQCAENCKIIVRDVFKLNSLQK
jgi:hypothetical protein